MTFVQEFAFTHHVYKLQQTTSCPSFLQFTPLLIPNVVLFFLKVQTLIVGCKAGAVQRATLTSLPHVDAQLLNCTKALHCLCLLIFLFMTTKYFAMVCFIKLFLYTELLSITANSYFNSFESSYI